MSFVKTFLTISIVLLATTMPGCTSDLVTPPHEPFVERSAPQPQAAPFELCCHEDICVQPRVGQAQCDGELVEQTWPECKPVRLSVVGPLWGCLKA